MNKRGWFIPILIVAVNVLAVLVRWSSLAEVIPAHFDLQGNAGGSMPRNVLLLYPLIGAVICLAAYAVSRIWHKFRTGLIIMASGIALVLLSSTMVSLTFGKFPFFMLAEPVILLLAVIASIITTVRSHRSNN